MVGSDVGSDSDRIRIGFGFESDLPKVDPMTPLVCVCMYVCVNECVCMCVYKGTVSEDKKNDEKNQKKNFFEKNFF